MWKQDHPSASYKKHTSTSRQILLQSKGWEKTFQLDGPMKQASIAILISNNIDKWPKQHLRNCSASLAIGEMQIKVILRYHLTPIRMAKIKNTDDSLCWRGCGVRAIWIWDLYMGIDMDLFAFFYMLTSNLCQHHLLKMLPFLLHDFGFFVKNHVLIGVWINIRVFDSIGPPIYFCANAKLFSLL